MARKWWDRLPLLSGYCDQLDHDACPHERLSRVQPSPRKIYAVQCTCDCHLRCPVGGRQEVPHDEWLGTCTCPGSAKSREIELQRNEVFRDLDLGRGRSAEEIRQQVLAAYAAHGYEPPSDYSLMSRFLAAGTGRRGTKYIRLLVETVRATRADVNRVSPSPAKPRAESTTTRHGMARNLHLQERMSAVYAVVFIGVAVSSYFTSGGILNAALLAATGLIALLFAVLFRALRRAANSPHAYGSNWVTAQRRTFLLHPFAWDSAPWEKDGGG